MCVRNEIILAKYFYPSNNSNDTLVSARIYSRKMAMAWSERMKLKHIKMYGWRRSRKKSEMKGKKFFFISILLQQLKWKFFFFFFQFSLPPCSTYFSFYLNGNQWSKMFCVNREKEWKMDMKGVTKSVDVCIMSCRENGDEDYTAVASCFM